MNDNQDFSWWKGKSKYQTNHKKKEDFSSEEVRILYKNISFAFCF
jgi:hypothetical protein